MVGENGEPVTPDWHCEPCAPVFDLVTHIKAALEPDATIGSHIVLGEN